MISFVLILFLVVIALLGGVLCYYQNKSFLLFNLAENRRLGRRVLVAGWLLLLIAVLGLVIFITLPLTWNLITVIAASLVTGFVALSFASSL
ncbi:hypothetical protein [Latilactobacillus sakei]|uniref:hypothetical protein n=1 Tax=Latilactobacillus sakei TaxID=1599 RepID=UPI000DC64892|nr:hypothetical protein [Latilactobacillus sakei]SPS03957.1 hypothetical protein LAS9624_00787 [Latilactobacillus sakei]